MLVINWMSTRLVSVGPEDTMSQASRLLKEHHISRLPVIEKDGKLVGIVTDRDIRQSSPSDAAVLEVHELAYLLSRVKVRDIMTPDPLSVHIYDTIEEAALKMLENKISGMPVLDTDGRIVAMLTDSDIFRALITLSGVTSGGMQFALDLADEPGSIKKAADIVRSHGGRMVSIFTSYDGCPEGKRRVYIRIKGMERQQMIRLKDELGSLGGLLYILDSRDGQKEFFALDQALCINSQDAVPKR